MVEIKFNASEIKQITSKIKKLESRYAKNALRRALRRAANIIRDQARQNAKLIDDPETAATIWKNIATATGGAKQERRVGGLIMRVGVMGGAKPLKKGTHVNLSGGNTTHWRWVEFGTSKVEATPFMRRAAKQKAQEALNTLVKEMQQQLKKEIEKRL